MGKVKAYEFIRDKYIQIFRFNSEIIKDVKFDKNKFMIERMSLFFYTHSLPEKEITISISPPTFLDWLFRRIKYKTVKINAKEILKKYPENNLSNRFYKLEEVKK